MKKNIAEAVGQYVLSGLAAALLSLGVAVAAAQEQDADTVDEGGGGVDKPEAVVETGAADEVGEEEAPVELATQVVTGSRLIGGDPSAQVYSFTAEDIARRGVSSLEEFFRRMPWAFPSISTQSFGGSDSEARRVTASGGLDLDSLIRGSQQIGVSTVNLRGLGSPNTLVLLDGRRIAGTGGQEADFVNLLNVPLSAIERVDIQLGGASAVYGTDAIGGVVNFITRRDYRGLSATWRHESSSTDADSTTASINAGWAWGSGSASAVLSRRTSKPILNARTGYDSLDFRPLFGPESGFDERIKNTGQPGIACELRKIPWVRPVWDPDQEPRPPTYRCASFSGPYYQLPAGHSGEGATVDDFLTFGYNESPLPLDEVARYNGLDSTATSLKLRAEQYINEDIRVHADVLWSLDESFRDDSGSADSFQVIVPASNAWNPFGKHMLVRYVPVRETATGLMPSPFNESENENLSIAAGLIWNFEALGSTQELQVEINRAKSWRDTSRFAIKSRRPFFDPTAEAWYEALSSSDPSRALNFFGDGTVQGSAFNDLLTQADGPFRGVNETRQYTATLRGNFFDMWGGAVTYAVRGEHRENIIYYRQSVYLDFEAISSSGADRFRDESSLLGSAGVERPTRDAQSFAVELALPFFGPDNARPGLNSLVLTLQASRSTHSSTGSLGGLYDTRVPVRLWYWDPDEGFASVETTRALRDVDPNLHTAEFGRISPRIGIQYKPAADFTVRLSWQRNYKAPSWQDLFGPYNPGEFDFRCFSGVECIDPFDPDGPTEIVRGSVRRITNAYAADVREESSDNYSASLDWAVPALPGMRWQLRWEKVDFTDKIQNSGSYVQRRPDLVLGLPEIAVRNERGDLVAVNIREFNIAEQLNASIYTELEYSFDTAFGGFMSRLGYHRYLDDYYQIAAGQEIQTALGAQKGNDLYQWDASLTWTRGRWAADIYAYYSPGYTQDSPRCSSADLALPGTRCTERGQTFEMYVSSLATVDFTLTLSMDNGLRIRAGGRNVLDRAAPIRYSEDNAPYDPTRWDARGQVFFLELNVQM